MGARADYVREEHVRRATAVTVQRPHSCLFHCSQIKAEGIFCINPENDQEEHAGDQLNKGVVPEDLGVHCLASLIKAWFRELPGVLDGLSPEQVLQFNSLSL